eukprot:Clim_evm17s99 gene=Clim_evmTU17s99
MRMLRMDNGQQLFVLALILGTLSGIAVGQDSLCQGAAGDVCGDNAKCVQTSGGFFCECLEGYEGDGINCTEIETGDGNEESSSGDDDGLGSGFIALVVVVVVLVALLLLSVLCVVRKFKKSIKESNAEYDGNQHAVTTDNDKKSGEVVEVPSFPVTSVETKQSKLFPVKTAPPV